MALQSASTEFRQNSAQLEMETDFPDMSWASISRIGNHPEDSEAASNRKPKADLHDIQEARSGKAQMLSELSIPLGSVCWEAELAVPSPGKEIVEDDSRLDQVREERSLGGDGLTSTIITLVRQFQDHILSVTESPHNDSVLSPEDARLCALVGSFVLENILASDSYRFESLALDQWRALLKAVPRFSAVLERQGIDPMQSLLTPFREEVVDGDTLLDTRSLGDDTQRLEKKVMRHCIQSADIASRDWDTIEGGLGRAAEHAARLAALVSSVDEGSYSWLWPAEGSMFDARTMDLLSSNPPGAKVDRVSSVVPGLISHVGGGETIVVRAKVAQWQGRSSLDKVSSV